MEYGQFCPIAKATEILGEKWTILIVRELLMGGCRFNELQCGLSSISPTMLSKRLDSLESYGLVLKKKIPNQKGFEYFPTRSCTELLPIILKLGEWGISWAKANLIDEDFDVELLMLYLKRSINPDGLAGVDTVIRFKFTDAKDLPNWWITVQNKQVELCHKDPGKEVDIYFTTTVKKMVDVWMGYDNYRKAIKNDELRVVGPKALINDINSWMASSIFYEFASAAEI